MSTENTLKLEEISLDYLVRAEAAIALSNDYWRLGKPGSFALSVAEVCAIHGVPAAGLNRLISTYCIAFSEQIFCEFCGCPVEFTSRTNYLENRRKSSWAAWRCNDCIEAEREAERRRQEDQGALRVQLLKEELTSASRSAPEIELMSFREVVFLLSLLRYAGSEDLDFIIPYELVSADLSPTSEYDHDIINKLFRRKLIAIHPGSKAESVIIEEGKLTGYFPLKVHWTLPLEGREISPAAFMEQLELRLRDRASWPEDWSEKTVKLFQEVALQECLQYLQVVVEDHGFELRVGDKTLLVLKDILRRYSVAQAYNFMWRAAKDAAAFYVRKDTSRRHAANTIPGAIQRMADRATAEGWDVKAYRRDFRAPQSMLSRVLFDVALGIGETGFTSIPPSPSFAPDGDLSGEQ